MKRLAALVLALSVVLGGARPAFAAHDDRVDPDDVLGLLDLAEVRLAHETQPYVWTFRTFSTWRTKQIWDRGFFVLQLDTTGTSDPDFVVVVRSIGRKLRAELFRKRLDGSEVYRRRLPTSRAGPSGAGVSLPASSLLFGPYRISFTWRALSLFTSPKCPATCIDAVPDEGTVEQPLDA